MFGLLFSFEGETSSDLVMKAKWTHLYSSRTQKLSTSAATIAGRAPVKIARCQVGRPVLRRTGFFLYRERNPKDKRILNVFLTEKGIEAQKKVEKVFLELDEICFDGFSEKERIDAINTLNRLYENLAKKKKE